MNDWPHGYTKWPHGYVKTITVEPLPAPVHLVWHLGAITPHGNMLMPRTDLTNPRQPAPPGRTTVTMQLTADQQVDLSISGEDAYGNPVDITGDVVWLSSDEAVITVTVDPLDDTKALASAVGPVGTASVTVTNDADRDGTGDFMGSLAIDVVAGDITEITVQAGEPEDKPSDTAE